MPPPSPASFEIYRYCLKLFFSALPRRSQGRHLGDRIDGQIKSPGIGNDGPHFSPVHSGKNAAATKRDAVPT